MQNKMYIGVGHFHWDTFTGKTRRRTRRTLLFSGPRRFGKEDASRGQVQDGSKTPDGPRRVGHLH